MKLNFKLKCRINRTELYNGKHIANVSTPAPDQYSSPNSFKIYSERPLGNVGDEIEPVVQMTGFIRQRKYIDKATGQEKTYYDDSTFLNFVEPQQATLAKAS
jgi:hypothetical protein